MSAERSLLRSLLKEARPKQWAKNVLVVVTRDDETSILSVRNLAYVHVLYVDQLNAYDVLCNKHILFSKKSVPTPKAKAETGAAS